MQFKEDFLSWSGKKENPFDDDDTLFLLLHHDKNKEIE